MKHAHSRRFDLPFKWPEPPFHVVLVEPEIPPNTGNIARLCAATGSQLHLVEPMGFKISDAKLKRAGLDYWDSIHPVVHPSLDSYLSGIDTSRLILFSTAGQRSYFDAIYRPGSALVFGSETKGLPDKLLARFANQVYGIPIQTDHVRSLNMSTAAGIVLYEALRQHQSFKPHEERM